MLPIHILEAITGKLLGDGSISIQHNRKGRIRFQHNTVDKDWCFYCYSFLDEYFPLNLPKYKKSLDIRLKRGYSESYYVQSKTSHSIELLKECWYNQGTKVIPRYLLSKAISPRLLSWWYQDDGSLNVEGNNPKKIILSTESFTDQECNFLIDEIRKKYLLTFSLDGQGRLILYDKPSIYYFLNIIRHYLHTCMRRKDVIITPHQISSHPKSKRTTIYLPKSLKIEQPTSQIKESLLQLPNLINEIADTNNLDKLYRWRQKQNLSSRKAYQIILDMNELYEIKVIQSLIGFQLSEVVTITFVINQILNSE
jgi:hypothetical protein